MTLNALREYEDELQNAREKALSVDELRQKNDIQRDKIDVVGSDGWMHDYVYACMECIYM